mmetsp:Transcript_76732/g.68771  ORF Transcript_76732/g.68771 Transcript_76732/m.68771 type:complete len:143 (-) Transcript_76732:73-501(-)
MAAEPIKKQEKDADNYFWFSLNDADWEPYAQMDDMEMTKITPEVRQNSNCFFTLISKKAGNRVFHMHVKLNNQIKIEFSVVIVRDKGVNGGQEGDNLIALKNNAKPIGLGKLIKSVSNYPNTHAFLKNIQNAVNAYKEKHVK